MQEITITSGAYTVTIYSTTIVDKLKNKLFLITPGTSLSNYTVGPKDTKIVNLLRITREININQGYIAASSTKTAKEVKQDLITIFKGGFASNISTLTYDGESLNGFIEDIQITEEARDITGDYPDDAVRYQVQLNFVVGTLTTG